MNYYHRKAEAYISLKKKEFNLYGKKREISLNVPCLLKTDPEAKINERYII
jgi:hypothetical protein